MTGIPKILLVEDELSLGFIVGELLRSRGFGVVHITEGPAAYPAYLAEKPDLLILDVMLPGENGLNIARKVRLEDKHIAILFLTARTMPQDLLEGFEAGGNDYLRKPFDMEELIIRIKVLLNQDRLLESSDVLKGKVAIGEFQYDILRRTLIHRGESRRLTAREGEVIKVLFQFRNRLLTRKDFLLQIWGDDDFFSSRSLDVYISKLRRYFKDDPMVQIINQRGFGYKLIC